MSILGYMTKLHLVLCFAAVTGMIVISVVPHVQAQAPAGEDSKIQQGYAIIASSGITLPRAGTVAGLFVAQEMRCHGRRARRALRSRGPPRYLWGPLWPIWPRSHASAPGAGDAGSSSHPAASRHAFAG